MLSLETEGRIAKIFLNLADRERDVEINRQVLSQNIDFDAYQVFTILDREGKNGVDAVNISDFLRRNGVYANLTELQFIIQFYDENMDNQLSYTEFLNLVLSENNFTLRRLARERVGTSYPRQTLPFNVEYAIVKLLERELELARSTLALVNDAKVRYDFNVHEIFHLVAGSYTITSESLRYFLNKNNVPVTDEDIRSIVRRLDINRDSQVSFPEFHSFFAFPDCPKCCSCRYANSCCCVLSCPSCRGCANVVSDELNNSINMGNTLNNMSTSMRSFDRSPRRKFADTTNMAGTQNMARSMSPDVKRVSSNLVLRMSPERRFSPRGTSPLRDTGMMARTSPIRQPSPMRTATNFARTSPLRCHSPCHSPCHRCCHVCGVAPCKCCLTCHHFPCTCCCRVCCHYPCVCCTIAYQNGERAFVNYMKEVMSVEDQIEKAKVDLALRSDFNVEDAYRIFEYNGRGFVTDDDLKYGLSQLDILATPNEIKLLMRRTDLRRSGTISYADFFDLVTPFEKDYRTMVEARRPSSFSPQFNKADVFLLSTKIYLQNLLRLIITLEKKLEGMRVGIPEAREQMHNIYHEIDRSGLGVIDDNDLGFFLKNRGAYCSERETGLAYIRLDRNRNGKVELWEFDDEISV